MSESDQTPGKDSAARVVPLEPSRTAKVRCPLCRKPATHEHRPFCSRRCADLDLAHWLDGNYRIATDEAPQDPGATGADDD